MLPNSPRSGIRFIGAPIALLVLLAGAGSARADATGRSFADSATITLTPSAGGVLTLSSDPTFRRAHATAFADHSDTPGSSFNESATITSATASASEPSVASVSNAFANLGSLSVGVDDAMSFAHRSPPSNARADGLGELEALFHVGFSTAPSTFNLLVNVSGSASLSGNSLTDENWSANYQFYIEIYDYTAPSSPTLFSTSRFNELDGPGPMSTTDAIAISQTVSGLNPGHDYGVYAYFDSESSAIAPAPGAAGLLGMAGLLAARRRRS